MIKIYAIKLLVTKALAKKDCAVPIFRFLYYTLNFGGTGSFSPRGVTLRRTPDHFSQ